MDEWIWMAMGAGLVLLIKGTYWLYWRFLGSGSLTGYIHKEEEPEGKYHVIRKVRTPTQRIALVEYEDEVWIYSNGDVMFSTTEDENKYAEALVHVPMAAAEKRKNILIIGGGGGVTTREALRYAEVEKITAVDIDEVMIDFGKNLKELVKFNNGALNHPKVQTVIEDGRTFVENSSATWDVIMIDLPEPTEQNPSLSRLFSQEFYSILKDRLEAGGAMAVACSTSSWMPEYFWGIQATLKSAGFHVVPYHLEFIVESGEDWGFCLASTSPIVADNLKMSVPTRYLTPKRLTDMFQMPFYFTNMDNQSDIQRDHNRVLIDIVTKYLSDST